MEKLSLENKIDILNGLLAVIKIDRPEFGEENSTGWDLYENTQLWLEELNESLLYLDELTGTN